MWGGGSGDYAGMNLSFFLTAFCLRWYGSYAIMDILADDALPMSGATVFDGVPMDSAARLMEL